MDQQPPKRQRQGEAMISGGKDRISELPDGIICEILNHLPTKNAVATTILSKRWKDQWTYCSNLDFSDGLLFNPRWPLDEATETCFINFVNKAIALNKSPYINKFLFQSDAMYESHVTTWIDSILTRNSKVKYIDLDASSDVESPVTFPQSLFTCQSLVFLNIASHAIYDIPTSLHLPCLKVFRVNLHNPSDVVTTKLFCDLPVLEDLSVSIWLYYVEELRLNIIIPSLKKLKFELDLCEGFDLHDYQIVVKAPRLNQLYIYDDILANYVFEELSLDVKARLALGRCCQEFENDQLAVRAVKAINQFCGVKYLSLSSCTLGTLDFYNAPGPVCVAEFPNLTCLEVDVAACCGWKYMPYLLERLPRLEVLALKMVLPHNDSTIVMCREPLGHMPQCLQLHLKKLKVRGFEGQQYGLRLLGFFLRFAKVLGEVVVCTRNMALEERRNLFQKLSSFPCSSKNCQLKIV